MSHQPPSTVKTPSRRYRLTSGALLLIVWAAAGWLWIPRVTPLVLLGAVLVMLHQLVVLRRSAGQMWSRDTAGIAAGRRGKLLVLVVLGGVLAAVILQSMGSWVDDSWTVLLLAALLAVLYAGSRRLLVTLTVACTIVLTAQAVLAPRLADAQAGDRQILGQLADLNEAGVLTGYRNVAIGEVDLSAPLPVRQATIGSLTDSTPMEVGSITKAMTGLVVADAIHRGELALDAPVSTYLPTLTGSPAGGATIRELVTHHAGYPEFGADSLRRAAWRAPIGRDFLDNDLGQMLAEANGASLTTAGTYAYSSLGAAVAGQAAAAAAGVSYADLMRTRLFEPLGMTQTKIPDARASVAAGASASGLPEMPWHVDGYAPAAGAVSTAHDLTLLATAALDGTAPGMTALDPIETIGPDELSVGMFWQISHWYNGQTVTWHNGQTSGHTAYLALDRRNRRAVVVLSDVARDDVTDLGVRLLADTPAPAALPANLHPVGAESLHLQCQGTGSPTVVLLAGQGDNTTTWNDLRGRLGPDVRTCAWDYPGVGASTGTDLMTAQRATTALDATLRAAGVPRPVVLVGHSIAGLTTRLFVAQHPRDVSGAVLLDPTVADFARLYDADGFRPGWDGTASAEQVEQVSAWPDIPFQILRHDPAVYARQDTWDADVEARWAADQSAFAALAPHGDVTVVPGAGHYIYRDAPDVAVSVIRQVLHQVVLP